MSAADRRALLRLVAAAMLFPAVSAVPVAAGAQGARFAPPAGPMLYTRRLERPLADGARLVASRSYAVRFEPVDGGYRVTGEQVGVEVSAPERLAAFARIEREREETGPFPLRLDANGQIVGGPAAPLSTQLDAAVREAIAELDARPRDPAERAELLRFVNAVHQTAGRLTTELPADLFAPPARPRTERREVALPNGEAGQVTVTFSAFADPATGLMRQAVREVLTELEGNRRRTIESWQLAPL